MSQNITIERYIAERLKYKYEIDGFHYIDTNYTIYEDGDYDFGTVVERDGKIYIMSGYVDYEIHFDNIKESDDHCEEFVELIRASPKLEQFYLELRDLKKKYGIKNEVDDEEDENEEQLLVI